MQMSGEKSKTFYRVTNKDIYDKLGSIEKYLGKLKGTTRWHSWAIGFIVLILTAVISRVV